MKAFKQNITPNARFCIFKLKVNIKQDRKQINFEYNII